MKRIVFGLTILLAQILYGLPFDEIVHIDSPFTIFIAPIVSLAVVIRFMIRNDIHNRVEEPFPGILLMTIGSILVAAT